MLWATSIAKRREIVIKGIFHLVNDVNARAGDYLIMREDDYVAVVSHAKLNDLFSVTPGAPVAAPAASEVAETTARKKRQWKSPETLERMRANGRRLAEARRRQRAAIAAE